jgi:hypothetical protein
MAALPHATTITHYPCHFPSIVLYPHQTKFKSTLSSNAHTSDTTSQLGTAVGGISRTAGGLVGTAGRGLGQTINNTTGTKAVGDGLQGLTNGVEDGVANLARGVEDGSKGKKIW